MDFVPVRSALQFQMGETGGPEPYWTNVGGPLGKLQGALEWQITHLCRFHQIMYADLQQRDSHLEAGWQRMKEALEKSKPLDDDDMEGWLNRESRAKTAVFDQD